MNVVTQITKLVSVESFLPDGSYSGIWGGYQVDLTHQGEKYLLKTTDGVRGMNIPCTVLVANGKVTVR